MSIPAALTTMAICQIIITAGLVIMLGVLIYAIFALKNMASQKIDEAMSKVQPVVDQAKSIAEQAKHTTESVGAKLDSIVTKAEDTAGRVTEKVEEASVSPQVATIAGVAGAALRFYQVYSELRRAQAPAPAAAPPRKVVVEVAPEAEVPASI